MPIVHSVEELNACLPTLLTEARLRGAEFETAREIAHDFADKLKRAGVARILAAFRGAIRALAPPHIPMTTLAITSR
jgi:hypothetical protein